MRRSFVRALWGSPEGNERSYGLRRQKMDKDLDFLLQNKHTQPFITYVFGKNNFDYLKSRGIECKLICENPFYYPVKENNWHQYGHKLKAIEEAMKDYDEIIFLDFDCMCTKPLPDNFWEQFYQKEALQAILRGYRLKKIHWRTKDRRKRPCASFIYLRDAQIATEMVKRWEEEPVRAEEDILMWQIDQMSNGWKGVDYYWDNFEPYCFYLENEESYRAFPAKKHKSKTKLFSHFNQQRRDKILRKR